MKQIGYDETVRQFLYEVCRHVKAKEMHCEIKQELQNHIVELVEEQLASGIVWEKAVEQAIRQMGDPLLIGGQLHKAHKPKIDWSLLGLIAMFVGIGLMSMYAVEMAYAGNRFPSFFTKKVIYSAIGIIFMLGLCFWDYRKLLPYSRHFYVATLLVMGWSLLFGKQINGSSQLHLGLTTINFISVSPFLLIICLAGIMASNWNGSIFPVKLTMYVLLPCVLYGLDHSSMSMIIYMAGFGFMYFSLRGHLGKLLCYLTPPLIIAFLILWMSPYQLERLLTYMNPYGDPQGNGYMTVQSIAAIQSAGWWGHGFASVLRTLPVIESEMLFTYIIYSLGWATGLGIGAMALVLLLRLAGIANKASDQFGSLVVKGLLAIFTLQFVWSILMSYGNGGMLAVVQMASIGIILSIYRQKNMFPAHSTLEKPTYR
jgi:cell division protein FtsW (lipid II flippase)